MADILGEFGKDTPQPQEPRATNGGVMPVRPTNYSPPVGPSSINDPKTPGLHGEVYPCGTQQRKR
jgi:hypothetical protein